MWNLKKNGTNELIYKTEIVTDVKNKRTVSYLGEKWGRINWEPGIDKYRLLYTK